MGRIKIRDLPKEMKVTRDDMRRIVGGGEALPMEEVSFHYGTIDWEYTTASRAGKARGNVEYTWEVEEAQI